MCAALKDLEAQDVLSGSVTKMEDDNMAFCSASLRRLEAPERKSLTEAAGRSGSAGVKIRQQMAFVGKWQRLGDEGRGALCSGSFRGSD
jgi:hypothetical protein